uniref:Uncharacterized protein n=1 Tax=Candidatus Kentrum sp. LPFa TaxID=2126335 RepID=A0A450W5T6_9GAMM|nr:MAG: hypothetical protein BECKLPF1236A_GA0070988_1006912 [Candidatus Kentron sp. LPFa]VFK28574.1 MAG: hypothetical protein BECKLPF1236C_GA0070990_1006811 [Candidatus Kentron sp. LPFa]
MTPKTINIYRNILMTPLAILPWCIHRNLPPLLIFFHMTTNALFQTIRPGTTPIIHSVITLMKQEIHMLLAHNQRWPHASTLILSLGNDMTNNARRKLTTSLCINRVDDKPILATKQTHKNQRDKV